MTLARIDLNLLLAFEALMQARSASRAGAAVGRRQPAMSAALARLRTLLGDEPVVRVAGEMRPSPKVLRLAPGVPEALRHLRAALGEAVAFDPGTATDTFALAFADSGSAVLLPDLAGPAGREAPGIDLRGIGCDKDDVGAIIDRRLAERRRDPRLATFPIPLARSDRANAWLRAKVGQVGAALALTSR